MRPPMMPMKTAAHAGHEAQPAVMETSPVSTPLHMHLTSHSLEPPKTRSMMTAVTPPKEAEMVVVAKMRAEVAVAEPVIARVEPALNPYLSGRACVRVSVRGEASGCVCAWRVGCRMRTIPSTE